MKRTAFDGLNRGRGGRPAGGEYDSTGAVPGAGDSHTFGCFTVSGAAFSGLVFVGFANVRGARLSFRAGDDPARILADRIRADPRCSGAAAGAAAGGSTWACSGVHLSGLLFDPTTVVPLASTQHEGRSATSGGASGLGRINAAYGGAAAAGAGALAASHGDGDRTLATERFSGRGDAPVRASAAASTDSTVARSAPESSAARPADNCSAHASGGAFAAAGAFAAGGDCGGERGERDGRGGESDGRVGDGDDSGAHRS